MSPVLYLVVAAVVLVIFLVVIAIGLIAVACHFLWKVYTARRRYDLIDRVLDRDPTAGLNEVHQALRYIDGDPGGRHSRGRNQRPPLLVDDNGFPSSNAMSPSLPERTRRAS